MDEEIGTNICKFTLKLLIDVHIYSICALFTAYLHTIVDFLLQLNNRPREIVKSLTIKVNSTVIDWDFTTLHDNSTTTSTTIFNYQSEY